MYIYIYNYISDWFLTADLLVKFCLHIYIYVYIYIYIYIHDPAWNICYIYMHIYIYIYVYTLYIHILVGDTHIYRLPLCFWVTTIFLCCSTMRVSIWQKKCCSSTQLYIYIYIDSIIFVTFLKQVFLFLSNFCCCKQGSLVQSDSLLV